MWPLLIAYTYSSQLVPIRIAVTNSNANTLRLRIASRIWSQALAKVTSRTSTISDQTIRWATMSIEGTAFSHLK